MIRKHTSQPSIAHAGATIVLTNNVSPLPHLSLMAAQAGHFLS